MSAARARSFVAFLKDLAGTQPISRDVHVILANLSAHETNLVKEFLVDHLHVKLHFTPTYSSRLNQVESGFSKLRAGDIDRGIFTLEENLKRKILLCAETRRLEVVMIHHAGLGQRTYRSPSHLSRLQTGSRV